LVEVVAAEVGVAVGRLDFEDAFAELEDRDVERAAAQVVDGDLLVGLLVEAVGQRGGRGLVDDSLDVEAGDAPRVLGRLALNVVEVGRDGDDRFGDLLAKVGLGVGLELDRKSTRLNSSHVAISYAVFCLKKKKITSTSSSSSALRAPRKFRESNANTRAIVRAL